MASPTWRLHAGSASGSAAALVANVGAATPNAPAIAAPRPSSARRSIRPFPAIAGRSVGFCVTLPIESLPSWIAGCKVRDNRKQVLLREVRHDLRHQRAPFSRSRAVLDVIELPEHVARRA